MSGIIPHSAVLAAQFQNYLDDSLKLAKGAFLGAQKSPHVRGLHKICLAGFCVLESFGKRDISLIKAAAETVRRVPFLLAAQQRSLAKIEYRRFIELVTWHPYFAQHSVEWNEFQKNPAAGFVRTLDTPISYCAHRERAFYSNYIKERFAAEKSGLVLESNDKLSAAYSELSFFVHAAELATRTHSFESIFEGPNVKSDAELQRIGREIMSAGILVFAAMNPVKIHRLNAVERGWFDWLIGSSRARVIRAGDFGVLV